MLRELKEVKPAYLGLGLFVSGLLYVFNPLGLDGAQNWLFSGLIFTVCMWATNALHKTISSLILLLVFFCFGQTPPLEILSFAYSDTMILIVMSGLLTTGISKTGLIEKYVSRIFQGRGGLAKLLFVPYLLGLGLIFVIPQAFARVIVIASICDSLLRGIEDRHRAAKQVILYNVFLAISVSSMFFINGDVVLNQSAIRFAGEEVSSFLNFGNWFELMALPSLVLSLFYLGILILVFRRELRGFDPGMIGTYEAKEGLPKSQQRLSLAIMLLVVLLWASQAWHGLGAGLVALVAVGLMLLIRVLTWQDLKAVNWHFLIFLLTAFSIGKVLGQSGISQIIFVQLKDYIPTGSVFFIGLSLAILLIHLLIGSAVATLSVVLPILVPISVELGYPAVLTCLTGFIVVNCHYLLPFHHATMMIGVGQGYYPDRYMLRYGLAVSLPLALLIAFIYVPWWSYLGLV